MLETKFLVHVDKMASHSYCRFISSRYRSLVPLLPRGTLLDRILMTVETIWELTVWEAAIRRCVHCGHKRVDMDRNNTQTGCDIWTMLSWFWGSPRSVPRKAPTVNLKCSLRQDVSMLLWNSPENKSEKRGGFSYYFHFLCFHPTTTFNFQKFTKCSCQLLTKDNPSDHDSVETELNINISYTG